MTGARYVRIVAKHTNATLLVIALVQLVEVASQRAIILINFWIAVSALKRHLPYKY